MITQKVFVLVKTSWRRRSPSSSEDVLKTPWWSRQIFAFVKRHQKMSSRRLEDVRYAELGSPCLFPLSNLQYGVVLPPFVTHDSGFFIKICIHFRKSLPKPIFFNTHIKKEWLIESKAFSISTVINIPSISKELVISRTSNISLPLPLINLLLTYATWFSFTMEEITLFNVSFYDRFL